MKNTEHTVRAFGIEVDNLTASIQEMKDMVIKLIRLSEKALSEPDESLIELARNKDAAINKLEKQISDQAITLLALRQPMATDLRFIVSTINIASLLERIGDRGKKTVKKTSKISNPIAKEVLEDIHKMNEIVISMIDEVFSNIAEYKFKSLKHAYEEDDKVDEFYSKTMHKIVANQEKNPDSLDEFIAKIKILKNYERIGDYTTKIAKIVYYIAEGSDDLK